MSIQSFLQGDRADIRVASSGQVIAGAHNVEDLAHLQADAPMLQQKMKPRHLQMIAVGA